MRGRIRPTGERGFALLTTIIVLLALGALGAALTGFVNSRLQSVSVEVDRLQAAYLAEAGLAQAIYEITNDRDAFGRDGIGRIAATSFGPGFFAVEHDPESKSLIGVGVVGGIRRVIVSKYE
jgi:type II secretory pathway component PulK